MPTRHIAIAPDQLIIAAKKIADCVESYKASRYAGHYLIIYEAINDARSLLALSCEVFDGEAHPQAMIRLGTLAADADPLPLLPRRTVSETTTWSSRFDGG